MSSFIDFGINSGMMDSVFYVTKFMGFGWAGMVITIIAAVVAAAASVYAGVASYEASKQQSQMMEDDKVMRKKERAEKTRRIAGAQRASFLASGISLTGEGTPEAMLGETYDFGIEEVKNISEHYSKRQEMVLAEGRKDYNLALLAGFSGAATSMGMSMGKGMDRTPYKEPAKTPKVRTLKGKGIGGLGDTEGTLGGLNSGTRTA